MAEDILDYWTRLIKTIFPENAWITSRFFKNDCLTKCRSIVMNKYNSFNKDLIRNN